MTRLFLFLFIGLMSTSIANGQIIVNFDNAENAPAGSQVTIDVAVDDFEDIVLFQFGVLWDPTVATFNSVTNVTNVLPQYTAADNIGTPISAPMEIQEGTIFTSWSLVSADAETLPDGTVLFSIILDIIGDECDETNLIVGDLPPDRFIEVYDETFSSNLGAISNGGAISIDGNDCEGGGGGGGDGEVGLIGEDLCVQPGDVFCMDVEVVNFTDIGTAQSGIVWDSTVLMYTGVQDFGLPGLSANLFNTNNVSSGELKFLWFDGTGSTPQTLVDSTVIFSVCFEVIGNLGASTPISFVDLPAPPPLLIEFSNGAGMTLPYTVENGSVMVSESCSPLSISGGAITNACPDTQVCVPFSVTNFENVGSVQYTMVWDTDFMTYTGPQNLNTNLPVTEFNLNAISPAGGGDPIKVRFSWNASAVCDEADGAILYEVCFDVNANATGSTTIDIVNDPPVNIEFGDCDGNAIPNNTVALNSGSVVIDCQPAGDCVVTFEVDAACAGETGGVTATVTDCTNPTLQWQDAAGNNCCGTSNVIFGQQPGNYSLCTTPEGGVQTCHTVTIPENPVINISVNTTNAFCGNNGSVQINISGGAGGVIPYTTSPAIEDETDVPVGTYTIIATDSNNCSTSTTFSIIETEAPDITISTDIMQPCVATESGIVNVTVNGGCGDASCTIGGQACSPNMVFPVGTYTVTVVDNGETFTEDFTVEATPVAIEGMTGPSNGNDGFISVTVVPSGCNDFSWTGPNGFTANSQNINGLAPGDYTVMVGCNNDCEAAATFTVFDVGECFILNINSTDVSCFGSTGASCDGTINATASGGCPLDAGFSLDGAPAVPALSVTGLCAGEYTVELVTSEGVQETRTVVIEEPEQLALAIDTISAGCGFSNGSIQLSISGGVAPYTVTWNQPGLMGENPTNVGSGIYSAIIEDANGCDILAQNIRLEDDCLNDNPCYNTASNILTPNGDGANDFFLIECASSVNNTLQVFDRWGREVYGATNYVNNWDGVETGGDILPEGAYMWVLEVDFGLGDIRVYQGTLTVLRD